jgi:gas vesicle protein
MKDAYRTQMPETSELTEESNMNGVKKFFGRLFLGGLAGATAMMLFAPKSGKRTRSTIQHHYDEIRDQVLESIADAEEDALAKASHARHGLRSKVKELRHQRH